MGADKRISKKQMKQDKLISSVFKTTEYIQKNPKPFYIGGTAIVVIFIVMMFSVWSSNKKYSESLTIFSRAHLSLDMGMADMAVQDLKLIVEDYSGTDRAPLACFTLANVLFEQKKYDESLLYYKKILSDYSNDDMMTASAASGAGTCSAMKSDFAEAGKYFKMAADINKDPIFAPAFLMKAGEYYSTAGNSEDAVRCYEIIRDKYSQSMEAVNAKRAIAELTY